MSCRDSGILQKNNLKIWLYFSTVDLVWTLYLQIRKNSVIQYEMLFEELCKRNNYLLHEYLSHKMENSCYCLAAHHWMQSAMGKCLAPITLWLQALTFFLSEVECHWNGFFFPFLCNCYFSNIDFHWAFDCRHYLTKCLSNTWKITLL